MRKISAIRIAGFKSIREANVALAPLNVLIGANGAGKSNFVGVFKLLNRIADRRLGLYVGEQGGANRVLHFGRKHTRCLKIALEIEKGKNSYECRLEPTATDALFFEDERCGFSGIFPTGFETEGYPIHLGHGHTESMLEEEARKHPGGIANYVLKDLQSWRLFHFHDTSPSAPVRQTGDLHDNRLLRDDARNLAAFLHQLRETRREAYQAIVDGIRMVAPFFEDFSLTPDALNASKIRLEWKHRSTDAYFDVSMLSDGTLRFICLATLLLQPSLPSIVLLDEPELGLHPAAITLLAELLRSASRQVQIIVATQSVGLVNQLKPEEVMVVDSTEGTSSFRRLDTDQLKAWLGDYGLGDLWEKNLLGGRP